MECKFHCHKMHRDCVKFAMTPGQSKEFPEKGSSTTYSKKGERGRGRAGSDGGMEKVDPSSTGVSRILFALLHLVLSPFLYLDLCHI